MTIPVERLIFCILFLPFIFSQAPIYSLQCHPDCNTCFGTQQNQCIRCANTNLKIQNGSCVETCISEFNYILQKCNNYINATFNVLNNPILFEVELDIKVFGEKFETLSKDYINIKIDELTSSNYSYTLHPNLASKRKYSFFILISYKQSVRILDKIYLTISLSIPYEYTQQGHILNSPSFNFQLHKYQNICDADQFYNYKTWNCEQRVNMISRLFVTEDQNKLKLAFNELDFQYFSMIEDFTTVTIQDMNASNFSYSIAGNFFQPKKGKLNLPEDFDNKVDNLNDFNIIINYTNEIIYQKPLITVDFSQFPEYLQTNSKFALRSNVAINTLIDNFQLSDSESNFIDGFSDTLAILNNIVEFLAIVCILGYPESVFVFVLLLQLKYPLMLKFMNIDYPPNINSFFKNQYAFETKWMYFFTFSKNTLRDLKLVSDNFELYDISPYFLDNIGDKILRVIILILICWLVYLANKQFGKKLNSQPSRFKQILQKFVQAYLIALPLSFILSYFFEISFYTWCSLQFAAIYSIKGVVNILISVLCFLLLNLFILSLYKVQVGQLQIYKKVSLRTNVKKGSTVILDDQTEIFSPDLPKSKVFPDSYIESDQYIASNEENKYYILQHDFANGKDFYTQYYIFLLALKYFVLSFILTLLHNFLAFQITVQCMIIIGFGILTLKYKPYQSNFFNKLCLSTDLLILVYQILLIVLIILDKIEDPTSQHINSRMLIGWILIGLYFGQLLFVFGYFLYFSTKIMISLVKQTQEANLQKQIAATNSPNSQQTPNSQMKTTDRQNSEKRFSPINFQVQQVNHGVDKNLNNLFINTDNLNPSSKNNKIPTSLQLNYLADKIQKRKTQKDQIPEIELEQGSFQLQEIEEKKQSVYPFEINEQQQDKSPEIQSKSHFESPLLKRSNVDFLGQNKSPKW